MKSYAYDKMPTDLLTPDIVAILTSFHKQKDKQELFIEAHIDAFTLFRD